MDEKIAFCGLDCLACPVSLAIQQGDKNTLTRIAGKWSGYDLNLDPKNIDCVGCTKDGNHFNWCDMCPIRKCAVGKKIKNCAYCIHYPCEDLKESHEKTPEAKKKLEEIRKEI